MADNQPVFPVSFRPCFSHLQADNGQNETIEQDVSSLNQAVDSVRANMMDYSFTRETVDFGDTRTSRDLSFSNVDFQIDSHMYERGSTETVNMFADSSSECIKTQNSQFGFTSPYTGDKIEIHDGKGNKNPCTIKSFYSANDRHIESAEISGLTVATSNEPVNKEGKEFLEPVDAPSANSAEIYIENLENEMSEVNDSYVGEEEESKVKEKLPEKSAVLENDDSEIINGTDDNIEMVDDGDTGVIADDDDDNSGVIADDDDNETIVDNEENEATVDNDDNETTIDNDDNDMVADNDSEIVNMTDDSDGDEWGKKAKSKRKMKVPTKKSEGQKIKSRSAILTEKKEHKCPTCGKVVQSLRSFEKHLNLHTDRYSCKICKKCFNSQNSLNTHKKVHEGYIGDEKCNVCDKTFYDKSSLNKHTLSVHMGITNFQCEYCERSFFAKKTYEEHVRVHTGERPFKCSICPKAYKRISDLNHHLRLHKGETKHTCEYCGEGFRRVSELKRHTQKHETGASDVKHQIHECEWCKVRFSTGKALKQHLNTHFESMCFDRTIVQKVYGESQRLVDGIVQDLSSRLGRELANETQNNQDMQPRDFGLQQRAQISNITGRLDLVSDTQPAMAKGYTSISQIHSEPDNSPKVVDHHQPFRLHDTENSSKDVDQSCRLHNTEDSPKVGNQSFRLHKTENSPKVVDHHQPFRLHNTENSTKVVDQSLRLHNTQVPERTEGDLNRQPYTDDNESETENVDNQVHLENSISHEKFEIKIENVEEDGVNNMYVGKIHGAEHFNTKFYNENESESYSNVEVKQEYDRDTDLEDYSYIIKSDVDDDDYDNDPTFDAGQYLSKNNQQSRKRNRKSQPLKRARKPKKLKVTNDTENGLDDGTEKMKDLSKKKKQPKKKGRPTKKKQKDLNEDTQTEDEYLGVAPLETAVESKPKKKKRIRTKPSALEEIPDCSSYVCEECGKKFSSKSCFRKHKNLHTGIYSCGICGKSCGSRSSLEIHEGRHEGRKPESSVCNVCDKEFYDPSSLNKHVKNVHMNFRPYPCTQCDRKFQERKTLEEHMRVHTGERPFKCQVCGKTYKRKSELNFHFKKHTGETKFTCVECDKGFRRLSEFKHHNVVHHCAERQYHCGLCFKKFSTSVQLKEHSNIHFGTKDHECPKCFKAFYTKSKLRKHLRIKRDCSTISSVVNGMLVCSLCQFECETQSELRTHIKSLHEASGNKSRNRVHLCKVCGKEFKRSGALRRHMKIHTQTRDYICNVCGAGFIQKHHLRQHMNTHTGEKPYQCEICLKSFAQNATLYSHMKHHSMPPSKLLKISPRDSEADSE